MVFLHQAKNASSTSKSDILIGSKGILTGLEYSLLLLDCLGRIGGAGACTSACASDASRLVILFTTVLLLLPLDEPARLCFSPFAAAI
jgi:hypothetical protein